MKFFVTKLIFVAVSILLLLTSHGTTSKGINQDDKNVPPIPEEVPEINEDRPIDGNDGEPDDDEPANDYENEPRSMFTVYEDERNREDEDDEGNGVDDDNDDAMMDQKQSKRNLCFTKECVVAAGQMLQMMNQSADPCHDFYSYACGNYKVTKEPFEDMTRTMSFEVLRRQNDFIIHNVLKGMPEKSGSKAIDNLKKLYDSCINSEHQSKKSLEAIKKILNKYGPWPMDRKSWDSKGWNFKKVLNELYTNVGLAPFFDLGVVLDSKDPDRNVFEVAQNGLGIPREYYLSKGHRKTQVRQAYRKLMMKVMNLFGYSKPFQKSMLQDVFNFEKELAKISISQTDLRKPDLMYKRTNIIKLEKITPEIDWKDLLQTELKMVNMKLNDVKYIIIFGESYFQKLDKLLKKTKKETKANYLLWSLVLELYRYGGEEFRELSFQFSKIYSGRSGRPPFWLSCISTAMSTMPFAFGRIYVDTRFKSKFAKKEIKRIVTELKRSFILNLKSVKWMSKTTKEKAKEKARAIKDLVAYPDYILDNKKLDKKYAGLDLKNDDFLGNILRLTTFQLKSNLLRLKVKRDRGRWESSPAVVNAFYSQLYNRIVFPAGILQPLYFHHEYPSPMKYGGIGTVIGHEITHAFDDLGRKYDKHGRLVQWWNSVDIKKFEKEADCIRKQYSSFSVYGHHMNGKLSCGENIADNGGVKIAYQAFRRHLKKYPNPKSLPGLQHLSNDQLFYVSFAKIWCSIESKARTLKNIVTDHHSYPKFRVLGTLSNSEEFSKAFKCKRGSAMNPAKKCKIW